MSSKKLIYFLVISLICGLIVGDVAHATIIGIKGTVSHADGAPVVGATVTAPGFGSLEVSSTTDTGGGYRIPYISFANVVIKVGDKITVQVTDTEGKVIEKTHTVTAADISVGEATFDITLVSTTVTVTVVPNSFSAETSGTGIVTVTVAEEEPVTDEIVTFQLSPNVGTVSSATNNGDGTYTANYTSGVTAGNVTLIATATQANASGTGPITINAGPPASLDLSAAPRTVSSGGRVTITAMVSDSNGNGVGGASLTGTSASGAPLTNFASATALGAYTATYTAPTVDTEGTETVTVMGDGLSAQLTLNLTPVPPREVLILVVEGTVFKEDGEIPADDVQVAVTVGANPPQMTTTDSDGNYSATTVNLGGIAASTGDPVLVVVTDAASVERGRANLTLTNDHLGEDNAATVILNVETDIVIPPRSVNILVLDGIAYKEDGTTPVGEGLDVTVTVGAQPPETIQTASDGSFSTTIINLLGPAATTGDMVSIAVADSSGERGTDNFNLSNSQLGEEDSTTVTRSVGTNIGLTSGLLAVTGTVYLKNGDTESVPAISFLRADDLTVVVTNTTRDLQMSRLVDDDGGYSVTFLDLLGTVVETGDALTIAVQNEAGETVGTVDHILSIPDVKASKAEVDIHTTVPAEVTALNITGNVVEIGGSSAGSGLEVTLTLAMNGHTLGAETRTDAAGDYGYTFVDLITPVAATGDILMVDVLRAADQFHGHAVIELRSYELVDQQITVDPITLIPPRLELGGLSINPHYTGDIHDSVVEQLLSIDLAAAGGNIIDPSGNLLALLPPLLSFIGAYQIELPSGFEPTDEHIAQESFGNAITTRPTAWATLPAAERHPGRWVNGDQLNLYLVGAPTINGVTFTLNGSPISGTSIPAGGSFMYNFQLEEELIALFSGNMPVFRAVQLMIDGQPPLDMARNGMGVWSVDAPVSPGSTVSYYYMIELSEPYYDSITGLTIARFPLIDPRNRQVNTAGLSQTIEGLLESGLDALDPGVRSVFSVPEVNYQQALWVGTFNLDADGMYQLDVNVSYRGGHQEGITGKMFYVDRTAPTADVALNLDAPGMNAGMYMRADGTYVATGPMPGQASLTVSAIPDATSEDAGYMYQLGKLDNLGQVDAWNPVVTANLLPLNLGQLLMDPASVLPMTLMPPHELQMLIRNSEGEALIGTYGLRTVGIDSLLNMDSSSAAGVILEFVPPDPDRSMISSVQADFDGNGFIEGLETQSAAGDVAIFSDSVVTLVVDVIERTTHPLASIAVEYQLPGGDWNPIAVFDADMLLNTALGDQLIVNWDVADYAALPDRGSTVMVRTVTTNALNVVDGEDRGMPMAYQRRLPPEVTAIHMQAMELHPDSGAPQGTITVSAFTQAMTSPDTAAVQLEIRRSADAADAWQPLGIVQLADTTVTSHVQIAIIEDLVSAVINGSPTAPIDLLYREWQLSVDSAILEDTILDDSPAASDASLDDNPYVLRAIAVDTASTGYPSAEGVTDSFSTDNYSPTAITQIANEVEMVAPREDGSYYVSGLLAENVPDPMLTLTAWTGAHPSAFTGGIKLTVTDTVSGASIGIPETGFNDSGNYTYTGNFNLGSIPNGTYTFMAVAHAADGSTEERIVAMEITVEVGNFTPPENFADPSVDILSVIDTENEVRSPSEIDTMYPIGFPAISDKITFTLTVPNVAASDLDVLIGDGAISGRMSGALTEDGMMVTANADGTTSFEITLDTTQFDEGMLNLVGTVTKPNGSVPFGLPSIRVDRSGPVLEIVSPLARHQVTTLPTIQVAYTDATGFDPNDMAMEPMPVVISLTRLADTKEIDVTETLIRITAAAPGEVLTQSGNIVYTHDDPVVGGAYRIEVAVTDVLGNASTAAPVEFTVEGVQPTVSIVSPLAGRIIDPRQPLIVSVALTGNGNITVTEFQINGTDMEGTLENNWLNYTMQPPLVDGDNSILQRGSDNTISVKIVDSEGRTAEGSTSFAVSLDDTPPVISGPAPKGEVTRKLGRITARVTDNESNITRIMLGIDDNPLKEISFSAGRDIEVGRGTEVQGQTNFNFTDAPLGTHTVTIVAESTGGASTLTWEFTIVNPDNTPPKVVTYSPLGIIRTDRPVLAATVSDESGFQRDGITLILAGVPGNQGSGRRSSPTSTTVTFTPSISVTPGPYTARLTVIDRYNNRTEAEWQFTVELDETPPAITTTSPHGVIHLDKPIISVSASDDMSGVDSIEIAVKDGRNLAVNGVTTVRSDKTAATFTPASALKDGTHTVDVTVTDMRGNQAASKWQFTVELDQIPPSVLITRPSQEHTEHRRPIISAAYTDNLSGVDVESVKLLLDGTPVEPDELSETQVVFTPTFDLPFGEHTVKLEVSDLAPKANSTVHEWTFYVERIGIANARNYPNPFEDETTIGFRLSRQARITIQIYDFTGRLVAQPVANSIREAGLVKIEWDGETSSGDNLARGVYFCHILMESELEPQSTILKMAIISD